MVDALEERPPEALSGRERQVLALMADGQSNRAIAGNWELRLAPIVSPFGLQADGQDVALIDCEVVDAYGRRCPTDYGRLDFTCTGPAVWRGGYNSGIVDSTNNLYLHTELGINRVAVRSTLSPGIIKVTAQRAGLACSDSAHFKPNCCDGRHFKLCATTLTSAGKSYLNTRPRLFCSRQGTAAPIPAYRRAWHTISASHCA